jgi:predicted RNA methylase
MAQEPDWLPDADDAEVADQLRHILKQSGYVDSGIQEVMEPRTWLPVLPYDGAPGTPLNTLLRLFHMDGSVSAEDAERAFQPLTLDQMTTARFVSRNGERISATVQIEPYNNLLVVRPRDADDEDKIMSISLTTLEMANFAVRGHSRKTLDLGTGSGVQALLAAPHSDEVCAVDINPRAVSTADFNCRWNRFRNVVCRQGSLFEPVSGETFDLIVCNPPFVISPGIRHRYRDSGAIGDRFALDLARRAPSFLNESGFFQMMFQWVETGEENWRDRLSHCLSGLGCDVWVLHTDTETPEAYVTGWLRTNTEKADPADASPADWLRYLERLGVRSISTGLVAMQRSSGRTNHVWFDDAPSDRSQPYGSAIPAIFAIRRYLEGKTEPSLLDERLVAAPSLRMIQESQLEGFGWRPKECELQLDSGFRYCYSDVDAGLAKIVAGCDGSRTVREIMDEAATDTRTQAGVADAKHLSQLRELAWYGFLKPAHLAEKLGDGTSQVRIAAD